MTDLWLTRRARPAADRFVSASTRAGGSQISYRPTREPESRAKGLHCR